MLKVKHTVCEIAHTFLKNCNNSYISILSSHAFARAKNYFSLMQKVPLYSNILFCSQMQVDVIQSCGGQGTVDGSRFRSGGGILWNILKTRDPKTYKEIMTKGREFQVWSKAVLVLQCIYVICVTFTMVPV